MLLHRNVDYLGDPKPGETGAQFGAGIGYGQAAMDGDRQDLVAAVELPVVRAPRRGIDRLDALVRAAGEVFRPARFAVTRDVSRRGDGKDAGVQQAPGDQRRGGRIAEADREVEGVPDQIADPLPG